MIRIYYPHFDLVSKGMLKSQNHIINIKLLTLMCDQVLVLPSHLLELPLTELFSLYSTLGDFFHDGRIATSIYQGQSNIIDYYYSKVESTDDHIRKRSYQLKADFILHSLFEEPRVIFRDNQKEKALFQIVYNDANTVQAAKTKNQKLKHSVSVFENEFINRSEAKGAYLTITDVQGMLSDLITHKQVYKSHYAFFTKNMISSYYYCGSLANSAIPAYNAYFVNIAYDDFSKSNPFHSNKIYSPDFLLNILLGLKVISNPSDILSLSSKDIDEIKHHNAWIDFRDSYHLLCLYADNLQELIDYESNKQKKIEIIKRVVFNILFSFVDTPITGIVGLFANGFWGLAMGIILKILVPFFTETKSIQLIQHRTTDIIIDRLIQTKEPLYIICCKIRNQIEKEMTLF